ncbi:MAG: alaS [Firmicutes bacterium]|nr:alaS [Bacillota bacterium]
MKLTGNELRNKFLQFFASKDHLILPSYPLIPENDPSLLLIGAGMAPFKPFFTGKMTPPHPRIATSQRCVRTGDIENVGRTARHHTFFEMLGNFSFGDYFKKEAISWAWEFVTKELQLPVDKLWITIHTGDDEAFDIWHDVIGLPPERIVRLEDNFWEIGTGPCGPCSEIYVDLGEERGCGSPDCAVGCDCDRFLEIWNLVFTQFNRDEDGNYTPLAKKNIDTGAGLERIASVLQNKPSNFETDLLYPIIEHASALACVPYGQSASSDVSLKVIADHARSMVVMIADGVLPSNEGRGYVLRRILRRAIRHGRLLGIEQLFLTGIVDVVGALFAEPYPYITEKKDYIKKVIALEEQRFHNTLAQGTDLLNGHIQELKKAGREILDGETAFQLYDTFGFPWELTHEILLEHGLQLDKQAFDQAMQEQRERARAGRQENEAKTVVPDLSGYDVSKLSYSETVDSANIFLLLRDGQVTDEIHDGEEAAVILDVTSFYAEGGGQVGDSGFITGPMGKMQVNVTHKLPDGTIYHLGQVLEGSLKSGETVVVQPDNEKKRDTARNHTATHLLQAALRQVLGTHVNQSGSSVDSDRLRFDFSHFSPVTEEQLAEVEQIVNQAILDGLPINIVETSQETARQMGAMALFGEKYGDRVRVVTAGDFSKELCGGSHVKNTAEIGLFTVVSEAGIGAGLRRVEAVTGRGAYRQLKKMNGILAASAAKFKTRAEELPEKIDAFFVKEKQLEQDLAAANNKLDKVVVEELIANRQIVGEVSIVASQATVADTNALRSLADKVRDRLQCGVVILGAVNQDKVNFVAMATANALDKGVHAGNIVKEMARVAGGGGGGRPDMAQAGGREPQKIADAIQAAVTVAINQVSA